MEPVRENGSGREEDADVAADFERMRVADEDRQMVAIAGREQNEGEQGHERVGIEPARENRIGREENEDLAAALQRLIDVDPQMVAIAGREQNRGEQNHGQDDIDYIYVPRDVVAGLVVLSRTTEMSYFVHNLKNLVYDGDPEIREFLRDRHDYGKIDFIEWCLFEHYDVEERKRESVWKKMKGRLDQRARNTRRPVGHTVARENRNGSEEDEDAAAALERIRLADKDPQMVAITDRERNRGNRNHEDDVDYIYVSRVEVAELLPRARRRAMSQFVLNLEILVYENDPEIREFLRDRHDYGKIDFIRRCLFEHYNVEERLRDNLWRDMEDSMNQRVRNNKCAENKRAQSEQRGRETANN